MAALPDDAAMSTTTTLATGPSRARRIAGGIAWMALTHLFGLLLLRRGAVALLEAAFGGSDGTAGGLGAIILGLIVIVAGPTGLAIWLRSQAWAAVAAAYVIGLAVLVAQYSL